MYLKLYLCLILCSVSLGIGAQPEEEEGQKDIKTFIVRKVSPMPTIEEPIVAVVAPASTPAPKLAQPSLAADKKGLSRLNLKPYKAEEKAKLRLGQYVVFSFEVNEEGRVSDIRIYDSSDLRLVDLLIDKLSATFWNPAKDEAGISKKFQFDYWVLVLSNKAEDGDFDEEY